MKTCMVTWLRPDGSTYASSQAAAGGDVAIPDCPDGNMEFDRQDWAWRPVYEQAIDSDVTMGEAEALWKMAAEGNMLAAVLLKLARL